MMMMMVIIIIIIIRSSAGLGIMRRKVSVLSNSSLISKSMEQIPPTEVNCGSVRKEITLTVWNRKVCYRCQFPPDVKVVSFIHNLQTRHAGPIRDPTFYINQ